MIKQSVYGHDKDCMCQYCVDKRSERAQNIDKITQQGIKTREPVWAKNHEPSNPEINVKANTIKELYRVRRNGRLSIWGTALGVYSAFWEWILVKILWLKVWDWARNVGGKNIPKSNPYTLFHKPNGYSLIFYSLGIWVWWILVTIIAAIIICSGMLLALIVLVFWTIMFFIASAPYPAIFIYSIILEFPASVLNRDFKKVGGGSYSLEWKHGLDIGLIAGAGLGVIVGITVGFAVGWGWGSVVLVVVFPFTSYLGYCMAS